jgi:hypothetical protein
MRDKNIAASGIYATNEDLQNMADKQNDVIDIAVEVLKKELKEEPLSPERIHTLIEVITSLSNINLLL